MRIADRKPDILVFCNYYLPGYKSGGGLRAMAAMVDRLGDAYNFWLVTRDHDGKLDRTPYQGIEVNKWTRVGKANVFYLSQNNIRPAVLRSRVLEVKPDVIYLNSFFAHLSAFVFFLRLFRLIPSCPVVLAPEGELRKGAMSVRRLRKQFYVFVFDRIKRKIPMIWKAASETERDEILRLVPVSEPILIAPSLSPKDVFDEYDESKKPVKKVGEAKMVFVSRFVRNKNFKWLLENLMEIRGRLKINIIGPLEDQQYWKECERLIARLPENITVEARGAIQFHDVPKTLFDHHFFIFPTLSENYGYVVLEAFGAGCPVIVSDQTAWTDLKEKGIGWDLPLSKPECWRDVMNSCINMDNEEYSRLSKQARAFSLSYLANDSLEEQTRQVIEFALNGAANE